jgi:hypothetical protein
VPCSVVLPNVGNEGHSYLHHMLTRYERLAPLTLFLPDTLWDDATHAKPHFVYDVVVRTAGAAAAAHGVRVPRKTGRWSSPRGRARAQTPARASWGHCQARGPTTPALIVAR